jgi:hypothetical protein
MALPAWNFTAKENNGVDTFVKARSIRPFRSGRPFRQRHSLRAAALHGKCENQPGLRNAIPGE